jgi:hypothetical protein
MLACTDVVPNEKAQCGKMLECSCLSPAYDAYDFQRVWHKFSVFHTPPDLKISKRDQEKIETRQPPYNPSIRVGHCQKLLTIVTLSHKKLLVKITSRRQA